jgi:hypothetical protein
MLASHGVHCQLEYIPYITYFQENLRFTLSTSSHASNQECEGVETVSASAILAGYQAPTRHGG